MSWDPELLLPFRDNVNININISFAVHNAVHNEMVRARNILAYIALSQSVEGAISSQIPLLPQSHTEGYKFDPLLHLPGISPYFDAVGSGLDHGAPRYCEVTAASYLIRHAAIYANDADYEDYIEPFIKKLNTTFSSASGKRRKGWKGPLSFFEKWKSM